MLESPLLVETMGEIPHISTIVYYLPRVLTMRRPLTYRRRLEVRLRQFPKCQSSNCLLSVLKLSFDMHVTRNNQLTSFFFKSTHVKYISR